MNTVNRDCLNHAGRVVVKIGSRVLVQRTGRPDIRRMRELVRQLARLHASGRDVILVSSGAVGAGMEALGMKRRPVTVPDLQMAAAVGQSRLMATYDELFARHDIKIGQILLTHDDLNHRARHLNARNTMRNLLEHRILPIVNENDVVAVDEIKFGDNDLLASLVAIMMEARALVLLTTVDGFRLPHGEGRTKRASVLAGVDAKTLSHAIGKGSDLSTGGMASKLQSAGMALSTGIPVVIANGRKDDVILRAMAGEDVGTFIRPAQRHEAGGLPMRKRWIAFFHKTRGSLTIDGGAVAALLNQGRSLLPAGIRQVDGEFGKGAVVNILSDEGRLIARGLSCYSSTNLRAIMGKKTSEIQGILGSRDYDEAVHRDNMVVMV
ncbi:MAG TPA: glutamate 5-kinase [Kiritimatiellia bacterium]|nr:glutamate 5-kinase [Kiritimatiellia bacterium]HMP00510.1 glutamate 5-kinase [Kiritimatiellia bacterium]HMP97910.1 glutamate 5-kinase [Kiritimatiellia bacterium]